jgi:hypothetical protein
MIRLYLSLFLISASSAALAADLTGIPEFINEMVAKHQFKRDELVLVFQEAEHRQDVRIPGFVH